MRGRAILIVAGASLLTSSPSVADESEREAVVAVTGSLGAGSDTLESSPGGRALALLRAGLAWTVAPPPLPAEPGYAWRGGLGPEVSASLLRGPETDASLLLGGLRLEAGFSQREQGLLRLNARGSLWLSGRLGTVRTAGATRPAAEASVGWSLRLGGSPLHLGGDVSVLGWRTDRPMPRQGAFVPHGSDPPRTERGTFIGIHAGLFMGAAL